MNSTNTDRAALESLQSFAYEHGEVAFGHLCTAAINGEEFAVVRVRTVLDVINGRTAIRPSTASAIKAIRATDTSNPDGSTARSLVL